MKRKIILFLSLFILPILLIAADSPYARRIRPVVGGFPVSCIENEVAYDMTGHKLGVCTNLGYQEVSIGGGSFAPLNATFITQTANATLTNEQALSVLATGIVKNTTTTGVLSIAVAGTDYESPLTFTTNDFDRVVNTISIDYTNGQESGEEAKGFLTAADWIIFNNKQSPLTFISPLTRDITDVSCPTCALTSGNLSQFAATTSAQLAGIISDETGTGNVMFNTSPQIITALLDSNSNELFKFIATASAVNEFTITNAATGNPPVISVTGGDSNIGMKFVAKGTANFWYDLSTGNNRFVLGASSATSSGNIWAEYLAGPGFTRIITDRAGSQVHVAGDAVSLGSSSAIDFSGTAAPNGGDTRISRLSANLIGIGTTSANSSGQIKALSYQTDTNCADSAGAAACGSASAGRVVIDTGATSVVVSTTSVTANSEIFPVFDSSLGTALGITCNTTVALPTISARTAGTSFTILIPVAPVTNPACYSYRILN